MKEEDWIRVEERLPTEEEWKQMGVVLTKTRNAYRVSGCSPTAMRRDGSGFWFDVTHWMPIVPPSTGGK